MQKISETTGLTLNLVVLLAGTLTAGIFWVASVNYELQTIRANLVQIRTALGMPVAKFIGPAEQFGTKSAWAGEKKCP